MSDQPEIIDLGVEDDGSLDSVLARFLQGMQGLESGAEESFSAAQAAAQQFIDTVDELANAFRDDALQSEIDQMVQLGMATQSADDILKQYMDDIASMPAKIDISAANNYGLPGAGGDEGDDSSGGGSGSLFGVAHGIRAASGLGRMAGLGAGGTEAFTGVADLLYLESALDKLGNMFPGVTAAISAAVDAGGGLAVVLPELAIVMAAVAAAVIILKDVHAEYEAELKAGEAAEAAAVESVKAYWTAVDTLSTNEIQKLLAQDQDKAQQQLDIQTRIGNEIVAQARASGDVWKDETDQQILLNDEQLRGKDSLKELYKEYDSAKKSADGLSDSVGLLQTALDQGAGAVRQANDALIKQAEGQIKQNQQFAADDQLSMDAAQKKLTALEQDRKAQQDAAEQLSNFAYANALSGDALQKNKDAVAAHMAQANADSAEIDHLNNVSLGLIQTHKDEAQAVKDADQAAKDYEARIKAITSAQDAYDKAIQKSQETLTNSLNDLTTKEKTSEYQYTPGSTQDTFARQTIALKEQADVAKIEEDTANKIEDIRTRLGETEARIVTDYNRQLFDDQIKAQDDIQKAQIDAQRTAAEDYTSYQERLADIGRSTAQDELQAAADRDFQRIARDEQSKNNQIQTETDHYGDQEEKLRRHLQDQESDIQRNLDITEAQQRRAEGRKLADAQTAADNAVDQEQITEKRKIEVAQDAQQKALADLNRSETEKITLLREAAYNQYEMLVIQENQREQIAMQTQQMIVSQAEALNAAATNSFIDDLNRLNAMASGSSGGSSAPNTTAPGGNILTFAEGGNFSAGQPFLMSEGGIPEFLNIGSGSYAMNAPALVYPLQSGSVTPASGSGGNADLSALIKAVSSGVERALASSPINTTPITQAVADGIMEVFRP